MILKGISVECMECLNKHTKKQKDRSCTSGDRENQTATGAKLFDMYFYGFNGTLIKIIN